MEKNWIKNSYQLMIKNNPSYFSNISYYVKLKITKY